MKSTVQFFTGHFVMVPLSMTYLHVHCLQHSLFEHFFNLYLTLKETKLETYGNTWDRSSANA